MSHFPKTLSFEKGYLGYLIYSDKFEKANKV